MLFYFECLQKRLVYSWACFIWKIWIALPLIPLWLKKNVRLFPMFELWTIVIPALPPTLDLWKYGKLLMTIFWLKFYSRRRGCHRNSHRLPVLGWYWGWCWVPPFWYCTESDPPSSGAWLVWVLLLGALSFPKYILVNEGTLAVSFCYPFLVRFWTWQIKCYSVVLTLLWSCAVVCYMLTPAILYSSSFIVVTIVYAGVAAAGFLMFGESTMSQFTLNMPQQYVPSKIAIWMTVRGSPNPPTVIPLASKN